MKFSWLRNKPLIFAVALVSAALPLTTFASEINPHAKIARRIFQNNYGGYINSYGEVNHLSDNSSVSTFMTKELWIDFPSTSPSGGGEWLEIGGTKGGMANSITIDNPNPEYGETYNWKGHFFAYSFYDASNGVHYHEGKVGSANPTGSHTYAIQRDFSSSNATRWVASVDNNAVYYLTISNVTQNTNKYTTAAAVSFGIESSDNTYTFTSGTSIDSVYTIPNTGNIWAIWQGSTTSLDHDTYNGMQSSWSQYDGVNNGATFTHN